MSRRRTPGSLAMQIRTCACFVKNAHWGWVLSAMKTRLSYLDTIFMIQWSYIRENAVKVTRTHTERGVMLFNRRQPRELVTRSTGDPDAMRKEGLSLVKRAARIDRLGAIGLRDQRVDLPPTESRHPAAGRGDGAKGSDKKPVEKVVDTLPGRGTE